MFFGVGEDTPRFARVCCWKVSTNYGLREVAQVTHLGDLKDQPGHQFMGPGQPFYRTSEYTLNLVRNPQALHDGSKPNKSIAKITGQKAPYSWRGPIVVVRIIKVYPESPKQGTSMTQRTKSKEDAEIREKLSSARHIGVL